MSSFPPEKLAAIAQEVSTLLKDKGKTVAVAETAAGGLISAGLLSTPGASQIYKGGLTACLVQLHTYFSSDDLYTLESRMAYAGWTEETLKDYKGPTPEIVAGLADHTRKTLGASFVVSESGTAGPTGGTTKNRTPGYVALAVSSEQGTYKKELDTGCGKDRQANMVAFAVEALTLLRDVLKGDAKL